MELAVNSGLKVLRTMLEEDRTAICGPRYQHLFGDVALVQHCQVHKMRNVLDHLPERQRTWAKAILQRAYRSSDVATARRLLLDLARRLETAAGALEAVKGFRRLKSHKAMPQLVVALRARDQQLGIADVVASVA